MRSDRRATLLALITAGVLWGTTIPMTKAALVGWGPVWLTVARFGLAALPLAWVARRRLRAAVSWRVLGWGVLGYGVVVALQNAGIARTSVSHASLIVGATPVLGAVLLVVLGRSRVGRLAWLGFALALAGIAVIAAHGDRTSTLTGDTMVFATALLSAGFLVAQPQLLAGRCPVAVTAVQLAAAALATTPFAIMIEGVPAAAPAPGPMLAMIGLAVVGTLVPFTLFAYAQARVSPDVAGAFLNLEPVVGLALGAVVFGDPVGPLQLAGGLAVLTGIVLTATPPRSAMMEGATRPQEGARPDATPAQAPVRRRLPARDPALGRHLHPLRGDRGQPRLATPAPRPAPRGDHTAHVVVVRRAVGGELRAVVDSAARVPVARPAHPAAHPG